MESPEEIKDVICTMCGKLTPSDELHDIDHDYGICEYCVESNHEKE